MATQPRSRITPRDYLARERAASSASQLVDGEMFAMSGGSFEHSRIAVNLIVTLDGQLTGTPFVVLNSDMRIAVPSVELYAYPDVSVCCSDPKMEDEQQDTLLNPVVLIEVLSPSTEAFDRGKKFRYYRQIDSLRQYVLVASESIAVEVFTRQNTGEWLMKAYSALDDDAALDAIGSRLPLAQIYRGLSYGRSTLQ